MANVYLRLTGIRGLLSGFLPTGFFFFLFAKEYTIVSFFAPRDLIALDIVFLFM